MPRGCFVHRTLQQQMTKMTTNSDLQVVWTVEQMNLGDLVPLVISFPRERAAVYTRRHMATTGESSRLLIGTKMALNLTVKVHPAVLFQIVDAYERRGVESQRVIGTLLGKWIVNLEKSTIVCIITDNSWQPRIHSSRAHHCRICQFMSLSMANFTQKRFS